MQRWQRRASGPDSAAFPRVRLPRMDEAEQSAARRGTGEKQSPSKARLELRTGEDRAVCAPSREPPRPRRRHFHRKSRSMATPESEIRTEDRRSSHLVESRLPRKLRKLSTKETARSDSSECALSELVQLDHQAVKDVVRESHR